MSEIRALRSVAAGLERMLAGLNRGDLHLKTVRILGSVLHRVEPAMGLPYALYARHDREARRSLPPMRTAGESG